MFDNQKLELFSRLLLTCHNLYCWDVQEDFTLYASSCPMEEVFFPILKLTVPAQILQSYSAGSVPVLVTDSTGLRWVISDARRGKSRFIMLGPFFSGSSSIREAEEQMNNHRLARVLREGTLSFLKRLPVIPLTRIQEYSIMLHYLLTEEKISVSDLSFPETVMPGRASSEDIFPVITRLETWYLEQELVRIIQDGDLASGDYINLLIARIPRSADTVESSLKNTALTCAVLFSRAAVDGGVSPSISLSMADIYLGSINECSAPEELEALLRTMYMDFIQRVRKCRQNASLSKTVQACRNYIDAHLEDPISLSEIAAEQGYAEYYLSKKYKKETGETISRYLRARRLERAAFLLAHSTESIQGISERLHFSSPSYFSDLFRQTYNLTPSEYRETMRHS